VEDARYVIVNGDDFGLSRSVNLGLTEAHERGIVTSASLMVDRPASAEAAAYAREHPRLGVGLHVELQAWQVSRLPRKGSARSAAALEQRTAAELDRQLKRFRSLVDRDPSHLDSHQHRHLRDVVRPLFEEQARALGVPLRRLDPRVRFVGDFYGHDGRGRPDTDAISPGSLIALLQGIDVGVTELGCHPGYAADLDDWYRMERELEVETLCDPAVRAAVRELEIHLCTFDDVRPVPLEGAGR